MATTKNCRIATTGTLFTTRTCPSGVHSEDEAPVHFFGVHREASVAAVGPVGVHAESKAP